MQISIFGLGYVGCVTAACLAKEGHHVIGVDVNQAKVRMLNDARSPIVEAGLEEMLREVSAGAAGAGSLRATEDAMDAVARSEVSLICVGTPSQPNGNLNLDYVRNCAREIGLGLKDKPGYHVVVLRSTVLPGSVPGVVIDEIERVAAKRPGDGFGVAMNPEFLRESTAISDFFDPPVTVIGEYDQRSGDVVAQMYHFLDAPLVRTDIGTAEMVKYANNCFHALKVTFANEMGTICKALGVDSHAVMDIFCMDDKLNLSPYYLKPGFAFGGSCLPKDLRALKYKAKEKDVEIPVLNSILYSNELHVARAVNDIITLGKKRVGILGLSFKAGTDDLRESPMVTLTEALIGKGYDIRIYDKNVSLARLVGANKQYIESQIPHISSLMMEDIADVVAHAEVLVIGNKAEEFSAALIKGAGDKAVYDLVRVAGETAGFPEGYQGICW